MTFCTHPGGVKTFFKFGIMSGAVVRACACVVWFGVGQTSLPCLKPKDCPPFCLVELINFGCCCCFYLLIHLFVPNFCITSKLKSGANQLHKLTTKLL